MYRWTAESPCSAGFPPRDARPVTHATSSVFFLLSFPEQSKVTREEPQQLQYIYSRTDSTFLRLSRSIYISYYYSTVQYCSLSLLKEIYTMTTLQLLRHLCPLQHFTGHSDTATHGNLI